MLRGVLNGEEASSLALVREIVKLLAGDQKGPEAVLQRSGAALRPGRRGAPHEAELNTMLNELGYDSRSISEGLAVVYGEMENSNYTGIGISCGGGLCNVCLAYLSVPVFSFSIPKAGDYIDSSVAKLRGEPATPIRTIKRRIVPLQRALREQIHHALSGVMKT
jgi:hypothetical protein